MRRHPPEAGCSLPSRLEAAWLARETLLVVLDEAGAGEPRLALDENGQARPLEFQSFRLPEHGDVEGEHGLAIVTFVPNSFRGDSQVMSATTSGGRSELRGEGLDDTAGQLKALLRSYLAPLDGKTRNDVVHFIARSVMEHRATARASETLYRLREALRERLLPHRNSPELLRGLIVEHILQVDERSFYLKGWMHDDEADVVRLTAVSPEGMRIDLLDKLYRYERPDVIEWATGFSKDLTGDDLGMIGFFELPAPSLLRRPWLLEMENAEGTAVEVVAPPVHQEELDVRAAILRDCSATTRRILDEELMEGHVMPAIMRIQGQRQAVPRIAAESEFGVGPDSPEVSIIVPLYRNIEYLEAQLAEFADDPDIHESDLIYVLDSPELAESLDYLATHLDPIYQVPFRVVCLEKNVGFAGANNAGASVARGRLLLLLNSDVLPDRPGWIRTMREFYDSKPDIGALAPKLIYEDESIQHAGMHFYKEPGSEMWLDAQFYRGLHRTFPAANVARAVPAVSGACMMIARDLYEELGGLSGHYVQGDYEDFDLCLRLLERGRENWYLPQAELYHLEGQSYTQELRSPSNRYNAWLHTHRWKEQIEELTERYADGGVRQASPSLTQDEGGGAVNLD